MTELIRALTEVLDPQRVLFEPEHLLTYGFDGTAALHGAASVVALPRSTDEVVAIVRIAAQRKIPIVSRGSGTGLSGGSVPVAVCIVLCLVQMDRILELDAKNLTLCAEAGVVTQKIAEAADSMGLL